MTEVWIVFFTVVVAVVVWLPRRTAVDGCQRQRPDRGGGVGLVQRAVLVELWRKIVHAALGFPAFALAASPPPLPSLLSLSFSCLPALFLTPFSSMETARTIFQLEMGEAIDLMKSTAGIMGREILC